MPYAPFKVEIVDVDVILGADARIISPVWRWRRFPASRCCVHRQNSAPRTVGMVGEITEQDPTINLRLTSAQSDKLAENPTQGEKDQNAGGVQPTDAEQTQQDQAAKQESEHKSDEAAKRLTEKISDTPGSSAPPGLFGGRRSGAR
jgi:hypothetical protein